MIKEKPIILVSRCLEHEACRYDGSMVKNKFINRLKDHIDFITVCPETEIGLSCPREVLRLIQPEEEILLVNSKTGEDFTYEMKKFSSDFIDDIKVKNINGIILKSKSPSCGIKDVKLYKSYGKVPTLSRRATGIFADNILNEFENLAIEDEGRLMNFDIREHFLTKVFVSFNFENVVREKSVKALIDFQSDYKYLLMAYSPSKQKEMGRIVANSTKETIADDLKEYGKILSQALVTKTTRNRNVNMLLHLLGYFSNDLSKEEKAFFLAAIEMYQNGKTPFALPLAIIKSWAIRFKSEYLLRQKIFDIFPVDLVDTLDSGNTGF